MTTKHWAQFWVSYRRTDTGYIITILTDVECHLFKRWSLNPPQIHKVPVIMRGLAVRQDVRLCFTAYHDKEQEEAGDTFLHTFLQDDWPVCQTHYFYFLGEIGGLPCASTSPIFEKHRPDQEHTLLISEPWTYKETSPPDFALLIKEGWPLGPARLLVSHLSNPGDAAHIWWTGSAWGIQTPTVDIHAGYGFDTQFLQGGPLIFRNITIPPNAIITSAKVMHLAFSNSPGEVCRTYLKGEKQANPATFSTVGDYFARPRTSASVDWSPIPPWNVFTWYETPDISNIIQELVDQPWWASGQKLCIFWEDHDGRSDAVWLASRRPYAWFPEYPERMPRIVITYYPI